MTRNEAIERACKIIAFAYHSINDYSFPSDGFCDACKKVQGTTWNYQNNGHIFDYVELAVREKLIEDGFTPDESMLLDNEKK